MNMNKQEEENFKYKAIEEGMGWRTVAIHAPGKSGIGHGTGVPVRIRDNFMILTAGHVISDVLTDDLRFVVRPEAEFIHVPVNKLRDGHRSPVKTQQKKLPVMEVKFTEENGSDVGIILLDPSSFKEYKDIHFTELGDFNAKTPEKLDLVVLTGFPDEIVSTWKEEASNQVIVHKEVHAYTEYPELLGSTTTQVPNFNAAIHFLMRFPEEELEDRADLVDRLGGISGAGIWKLQKHGTDQVWSLKDIELIGIQTAVYHPSRLIKATRIEQVIQDITAFLQL